MKNIRKLLKNNKVVKIFHYARFDIGVLHRNLNFITQNIYCTKIASKIAIKMEKLKRLSHMNKSVDLSKCKYELENKFKIKVDYLEFRDEKKLQLNNFKSKYRLFIAYYINGVRLIDNF